MENDGISGIVQQLTDIDEERRGKAKKAAEEALPASIRSIEFTEVEITLHPSLLPFEHVNWRELTDRLAAQFSVTPAISPKVQALQQRGLDASEIHDLLELSFQHDRKIRFNRGRFGTGQSTFVPIGGIRFSDESIGTRVQGPTEVAEVLLQEAFETLWQASGVAKHWSSTDVQSAIALKQYATHTKVNVGQDLLGIFASPVREYLAGNTVEGTSYARTMLPRSALDGFSAPTSVVAAVNLDELHFSVRSFETVTGRSSDGLVRLSVVARDESGRGYIDVMTEQPFADHVAFVEGLTAAIRSSS